MDVANVIEISHRSKEHTLEQKLFLFGVGWGGGLDRRTGHPHRFAMQFL